MFELWRKIVGLIFGLPARLQGKGKVQEEPSASTEEASPTSLTFEVQATKRKGGGLTIIGNVTVFYEGDLSVPNGSVITVNAVKTGDGTYRAIDRPSVVNTRRAAVSTREG